MANELLFSRVGPDIWCARRQAGKVVEIQLDPQDRRIRSGNLLKLRVERVLPGIQAAFLEMPVRPNAYLNAQDLQPDEQGKRPRIEHALRSGEEVLVRIEREGFGLKGPRVTTRLSLPGRYWVYLPNQPVYRVSRRVRDADQRERLERIAGELPGPGGWLARTSGATVDQELLRADGRRVHAAWSELEARAATAQAPEVLYAEPELPLRVLRGTSAEEIERIWFDWPEDHDEAQDWLREVAPELARRTALHEGPTSLWESAELSELLERALRPKVWLRSGGFLVIEETEALVSVDVNTGRHLGRDDAEETVRRTNLEAAREIAKQLRLRDLGGIIVIDFIDMRDDSSREVVLRELEQALIDDPERTAVGTFSGLGLLEMTRRRDRQHPKRLLTQACSGLEGDGRRPNARAIAHRIYLELVQRRRAGRASERLRAHPETIEAIEARLDQRSSVRLDGVQLQRVPDWPFHRFAIEP